MCWNQVSVVTASIVAERTSVRPITTRRRARRLLTGTAAIDVAAPPLALSSRSPVSVFRSYGWKFGDNQNEMCGMSV